MAIKPTKKRAVRRPRKRLLKQGEKAILIQHIAREIAKVLPQNGNVVRKKIRFEESICTEDECDGTVGKLWPVAIPTNGIMILAYPCDECGRLYSRPNGAGIETKTGLPIFSDGSKGLAKNQQGKIVERFWVGFIS